MSDTPSKPIPENIPDTIIALAQRILDHDASLHGKDRASHHETFLRLLDDLINYAWDNGRRIRIQPLVGEPIEDLAIILVFSKNLIDTLNREKTLQQFGIEHDPDVRRIRRSNLIWHMEDTDHKRIQAMVNEIRLTLQNSIEFEESRLLSLLFAIETFQKRLHGRKPRFSLRGLFEDDI